jgi:hypothetical protein
VTILFESLLQSTATLFETGIAYAAMALLIALLTRRSIRATIVVAAILHLVRPELVLVSAVVFVLIGLQERRWFLGWWVIAAVPCALYYGYMALSGAGVVPTSIVGRAILAREIHSTWIERISDLAGQHEIRFYIAALLLLGVSAVLDWRRTLPAAVTVLPIVILYVVFPTGYSYYIPRYLVPALPGLLFGFLTTSSEIIRRSSITAMPWLRKHDGQAVVSLSVATAVVLVFGRYEPRLDAYSADMILQRDLASALSERVQPDDRVLMYEIQGQYYLPAFGISADGIVGREAHDFLTRRETFDQFVERQRIKYVVTFNAFAYRPIYQGTPLVQLYAHDLTASVGDQICLGQWCYTKLLTNPYFSRNYTEAPVAGLNVGTSLRLYAGDGNPKLRGQLIQWNSVYRVTRQTS